MKSTSRAGNRDKLPAGFKDSKKATKAFTKLLNTKKSSLKSGLRASDKAEINL